MKDPKVGGGSEGTCKVTQNQPRHVPSISVIIIPLQKLGPYKARLRGDTNEEELDDYIDEQMTQAIQASLNSQYEWEQRQNFRQQTRGSDNIYEQGGSSHASNSDASRPQDIDFNLSEDQKPKISGCFMDAARKKPKISGRFMDAARKKPREVVVKFITYERVVMNVTRSPWLHNLIVVATEVGKRVKCQTPYEISIVCLKAGYNNMHEWIKTLKCTWNETEVKIMCYGRTNSINHKYIMNFLVYSSKGMIFKNSIDDSDVDSRNTDYNFKLLNKIVDDMGEDYVFHIITDDEKTLKAAGQKLMKNRSHLYCAHLIA
ncbi:hypothetical protein Lal_00021304 [Lupinus albus]|nr:hypothetical protein Lal_00021304 [Lupinus albus]